jgi:glycosyltransferase involved in cell wall biosynthesis
MKIFVVVNSMVQGGAQRFTADFTRELSNRGHHVTLLTFYPEDSDFFQIPNGVEVLRFVHPFHDRGRIPPKLFGRQIGYRWVRGFWRLNDLLSIRNLIVKEKPDLVIAVERYVGVLVGLVMPKKIGFLISERVHPGFHKMSRIFGSIDSLITKIVYRRKNLVVHAQGIDISKHISSKMRKPVVTIPNFVNPTFKLNRELTRRNIVLAVGRYAEQKGYDLLIRAWSEISNEFRNGWELHIYGDGDSAPYMKLVHELSLSDSIRLFGPTKNVSALYDQSSIFVLSSRYEGFPNVLAEAMASGLPCIVTDSPSAVRDLTLSGNLARLVPINHKELALSLMDFINNPTSRNSFANKAKSVLELFSSKAIMPYWEDLIEFAVDVNKSFNVRCPLCGARVTDNQIREVKTRAQVKAELRSRCKIDYSGEVQASSELLFRYKCPGCEVEFFNGAPGDEDFYKACYENPEYQRAENWDYVAIVEMLHLATPSYRQPKRVLDVGSGRSKFIDLIPDAHSNVDIVEIDPKIVEIQKNLVHGAYRSLEDVQGKYDVIVLSHFLEHVENPNAIIETIGELCDKETTVFITVPDADISEKSDSPLDWPPHHTFRFSKTALSKLMRQRGFRLITTLQNKDESNSPFDFCSAFRLL